MSAGYRGACFMVYAVLYVRDQDAGLSDRRATTTVGCIDQGNRVDAGTGDSARPRRVPGDPARGCRRYACRHVWGRSASHGAEPGRLEPWLRSSSIRRVRRSPQGESSPARRPAPAALLGGNASRAVRRYFRHPSGDQAVGAVQGNRGRSCDRRTSRPNSSGVRCSPSGRVDRCDGDRAFARFGDPKSEALRARARRTPARSRLSGTDARSAVSAPVHCGRKRTSFNSEAGR